MMWGYDSNFCSKDSLLVKVLCAGLDGILFCHVLNCASNRIWCICLYICINIDTKIYQSQITKYTYLDFDIKAMNSNIGIKCYYRSKNYAVLVMF